MFTLCANMMPSVCAFQTSWTGSWCGSVTAASCQVCCPVICRLLPVRNTGTQSVPVQSLGRLCISIHSKVYIHLCGLPWCLRYRTSPPETVADKASTFLTMSWVVLGSMWGAASSHLVHPDSPSRSIQDSALPRWRYKCLKWSHETMLLIRGCQQHSAHNLKKPHCLTGSLSGTQKAVINQWVNPCTPLTTSVHKSTRYYFPYGKWQRNFPPINFKPFWHALIFITLNIPQHNC